MYNAIRSLNTAGASLVIALERLLEVNMHMSGEQHSRPPSYEKYHEAFRNYQFYNCEFHEIWQALRALPGFKNTDELMAMATSALQQAVAAAPQSSHGAFAVEQLDEAILALQTALSRVKTNRSHCSLRGACLEVASGIDQLLQWAQVVQGEIAKQAESSGMSADEAYTEANARYQSARMEVQEVHQELRAIACSEKQSVRQALHKATEDLINVVQTGVESLGQELHHDWLTFIATVPRVQSEQAIDLFMTFNFELNGSIERERLVERFTLNFLQAGENLAILGGIGTGKTTIASALLAEAQATGRTTEQLLYQGSFGSNLEVLEATDGQQFRFRERLVHCDLLVVDEASTRLRDLNAARFLELIALRTELKRSTMLIMDSGTNETETSSEVSMAMGRMQHVLYTGDVNVRRLYR